MGRSFWIKTANTNSTLKIFPFVCHTDYIGIRNHFYTNSTSHSTPRHHKTSETFGHCSVSLSSVCVKWIGTTCRQTNELQPQVTGGVNMAEEPPGWNKGKTV